MKYLKTSFPSGGGKAMKQITKECEWMNQMADSSDFLSKEVTEPPVERRGQQQTVGLRSPAPDEPTGVAMGNQGGQQVGAPDVPMAVPEEISFSRVWQPKGPVGNWLWDTWERQRSVFDPKKASTKSRGATCCRSVALHRSSPPWHGFSH